MPKNEFGMHTDRNMHERRGVWGEGKTGEEPVAKCEYCHEPMHVYKETKFEYIMACVGWISVNGVPQPCPNNVYEINPKKHWLPSKQFLIQRRPGTWVYPGMVDDLRRLDFRPRRVV